MKVKISNLEQKLQLLYEKSRNPSILELLSEGLESRKLLKIIVAHIVKPELTKIVAACFSEILLIVLEDVFLDDITDTENQWKFIALSKLTSVHPSIQIFAYNVLEKQKTLPYWYKAKNKSKVGPNDAEIVKSCYDFLKSDFNLFKHIWDWTKFFDLYWDVGCQRQKLYSCKILNLLTSASQYSLSNLLEASGISLETQVVEVDDHVERPFFPEATDTWIQFDTLSYMNIEGVLLPIRKTSPNNTINDDIILVESTRTNLRSVATAISFNRPVCLSGNVGCGKTMLVEYLARLTGRLRNYGDYESNSENIVPSNGAESVKRKLEETVYEIDNHENGLPFLRVQLGDQTDSKTLLGQYRCTDIPGEFVWQPGILTRAVMNGSWILFEDLNYATQEVCTVLNSLLENNYLTVPGFRDHLRIKPGFQIFFTIRSHTSTNISTQDRPYVHLEKYYHTVQVQPLSRDELCTIVRERFANLSTIHNKIVDIYLHFSSGGHQNMDDHLEMMDVGENNGQSTVQIGSQRKSYSGRLISTRDLLKLCVRSNYTFNASNPEIAFFVFKNAVDLFCSHLPEGKLQTDLIIEVGAKLGIVESRCKVLAHEYKPEVEITSAVVKIGQTKLHREFPKTKKIRADLNQQEPTFSFTRIASCILERIAVSVAGKEPVLLIGETGVGKTSSVQYLANKLKRKLTVVNLNNQSDVSDLIGGYKPVDLAFILTPMLLEFEMLFRKTFDVSKNEAFLSNVSTVFHQKSFKVLVKLMLPIAKLAVPKSKDDTSKKWQTLNVKLEKLNRQLSDNANICFAFITGSLIKCLENGDWILLDEINLSSTETLEYLSIILEPNSSLILVEKGDFKPVYRHPNFRIFACMNPSTDVGKKDLPQSIRNRFTEFFVDELSSEVDLFTLVRDYLRTSSIDQSKISAAVKLYRKLCSMSTLELVDSLGNRPVFSLRTLCRALIISGRNLCGSFERSIYEGFCLSFLTQLDIDSREKVLSLIKSILLRNSVGILSQELPKPNGDFIKMEGYWIKKGPNDLQACEEYILTESVRMNLQDVVRVVSIGHLPVLLQGPTSAGKTSLINYIARKSGNVCVRINNHEHTDITEYCGTYVADTSGKLVFMEGLLVQAMRKGYWIILDELNLASSDILEALNRVLDDNRELYIPETQEVVKAHENFMLFATQNPPGLYGGRKALSRAFKNRFVELHFAEIPKLELQEILEKRCLIPKSYSEKMVKTISELQVNRHSSVLRYSTSPLRDLLRWGNRYTFANKELMTDQKYDWNQHLIEEGFLVLSSRVREDSDVEIIIGALKTHFRKRVIIENMFTLTEGTSPVVQPILAEIEKFSETIVLTSNIRRMAVLIAKALEFNEPVLLVGPTGCGKTTLCQILAQIAIKNLRILNCHLHTESSDFLGSLRPYRGMEKENHQLFEWVDGPLIESMQEGSFFLADEISLAEDAVLERLNCLLEPDRTLLLAEKATSEDARSRSEEIVAKDGFQFLATMNPGGDFGKKELSPALRNRFSEIWCRPAESRNDLIQIAVQYVNTEERLALAEIIVDTTLYIREIVEKFVFSIRDILAWCSYLSKNQKISGALMYGLQVVYLYALEMLPLTSDEVESIKTKVCEFVNAKCDEIKLSKSIQYLIQADSNIRNIDNTGTKFGISPFFIQDVNNGDTSKDFLFTAPTTRENLFRILSAFTIDKSILMEGAPGVGKTSLVDNLAKVIGFKLVRINLCEQTDLADLLGTYLPNENCENGSFKWQDGPLLNALKAPRTWILLDELNLAPQTVLEGLNSILDHRREVFIPELNIKFKMGEQTRIFATQNPIRQGGGRKGLPQSFLNRFTKIILRKMDHDDLLHVITRKYNFGKCTELAERIVTFSETVDGAFTNLECGHKGGPFDVNLRDIMCWMDLYLESNNTLQQSAINYQVLFEKMKLVYMERLRTEQDKEYLVQLFSNAFQVDGTALYAQSKDIGIYWNNSRLFINDTVIEMTDSNYVKQTSCPLLLDSQLSTIRNLADCFELRKPVILCGPSDCGKSKLVEAFTNVKNIRLFTDIIEDSVTGNFQQFDFNRHLEGLVNQLEIILNEKLNALAFDNISSRNRKPQFLKLVAVWNSLIDISKCKSVSENSGKLSIDELIVCKNKLQVLHEVFNRIHLEKGSLEVSINAQLEFLSRTLNTMTSLSSGSKFEWADSKIVKTIRSGGTISLDHINLTPAAILDRLNSVFEPDGSILISEKSDTIEANVKKHGDFQAILCMNPRNGEISRAMRNRCVEIALAEEEYTRRDLHRLVYDCNIHDFHLICTIIRMHEALKHTTDFNCFTVGHLLKFSFMVKANIYFGVERHIALKLAASEVYVRGSVIDYSGFGLQFYRRTLWQTIEKEAQSLSTDDATWVDYGKLCPSVGNLTVSSMIHLQCEPLIALLRHSILKSTTDKLQVLNDLGLAVTSPEIDTKLLQYYLYMIYQCASSDVGARHRYLVSAFLSMTAESIQIFDTLNNKFKGDVGSLNNSLPWNSKLFPRIRTECNTRQNEISNLLMLHLVMDRIEVSKTTKTFEMDAITYSKNVSVKLVNNDLLTNLYTFLTEFCSSLDVMVTKIDTTQEGLQYLWLNRLYQTSRKKLFKNNRINQHLLDSLMLHFKWLDKHLLKYLSFDDKIVLSVNKLRKSYEARQPEKASVKRNFAKRFINYKPIASERDITMYNSVKQVAQNRANISSNTTEHEKVINSLCVILNGDNQPALKGWFDETDYHTLLINNIQIERRPNNDANSLSMKQLDKVHLKDYRIVLETLPVHEYFVLLALITKLHFSYETEAASLNPCYFLESKTISPTTLALIKALELPEVKPILGEWATQSLINKDSATCFKIIQTEINDFLLRTIANRSSICHNALNEETYNQSQITYKIFDSGPTLTEGLLTLLLSNDGCIRNIELGQFNSWQATLDMLRHILWNNQHLLLQNHAKFQLNFSRKVATVLLSQMNDIEELDVELKELQNILHELIQREDLDMLYQKSLIDVLTGAIELNLTTYMPFIDPVEKQALKIAYFEQDKNHLQRLLFAYELMGSNMNYKNFGETIVQDLKNMLTVLTVRVHALDKNVAVRPDAPDAPSYTDLTAEVRSLLDNFCSPQKFLDLVTMLEDKRDNEASQRISLRLMNVSISLQKIKEKHGAYYRDFVAPLEYSLNLLSIGMNGLLDSMQKSANTTAVAALHPFNNISDLLPLIAKIEQHDDIFLQLTSCKLSEIFQRILISKDVQTDLTPLSDIFEGFVKIYQRQEELQAKMKEEAESLYVTKTHCEDESDELITADEIKNIFPTYVDDFSDIISEALLENQTTSKSATKHLSKITSPGYVGEVANTFINSMIYYSRTWYYKPPPSICDQNYLNKFETKLQVYGQIFNSVKEGLKFEVDYKNFASLCLAIGVAQQKYGEKQLCTVVKDSDYYKDSNIDEALSCIPALDEIAVHVHQQLQQYPDHAVLQDINIIIDRVKRLPCSSPLVRFNTGLQILRQKLNEWNGLAHRNNNMRDLEGKIAECIHRWTKLELQSWRNCLSESFKRAQSYVYHFWINLMEIVVEFTKSNKTLADLSVFETYVQKFMEHSSCVQYSMRLRLLKSFELYTVQISSTHEIKTTLTSVLHNLYNYYSQFEKQIEEKLKTIKAPIEKKLEEFVKIQSFSSDLSYFNMKNSISRIHRQLHKLFTDYENEIKAPVTDLISNLSNNKVHPIALEEYRTSEILPEHLINDNTGKEVKYLRESQDQIKDIVNMAPFVDIHRQLEDIIIDQSENLIHLEKLEVDRSQEKPRQKAEAKQIIIQKRKGLLTSFKTIHELGINYRAGLNVPDVKNVIGFRVPPFDLTNVSSFTKHELDNDLQKHGTSTEKWNECMFKMKLLTKAFQTPRDEIGVSNLERIKGFAIEFFSFGQKQRTAVGKVVHGLYELRKVLHYLRSCQNGFSKETITTEKAYVSKVIEIAEHLEILIKYIPTSQMPQFSAVQNNDTLDKVRQANDLVISLSSVSRDYFNCLAQYDDELFCAFTPQMQRMSTNITNTLEKIVSICHDMPVFDGDIIEIKTLLSQLSTNDNIEAVTECTKSSSELRKEILKESLVSIQRLQKRCNDESKKRKEDSKQLVFLENELNVCWETLNVEKITSIANEILEVKLQSKEHVARDVILIVTQYCRLVEYICVQYLGAHKITVTILNTFLTFFLDLSSNGFSIPDDIMVDQKESQDGQSNAGGFSLDNGEGETNVSDKIESEDQLENAESKDQKSNEEDNKNCKEENGIDFSEDFEADAQDLEKKSDEERDEEKESELNQEMGENNGEDEQLNEQNWDFGEENENQLEDSEMNDVKESEQGPNDKQDHDTTKNEIQDNQNNNENEEGLDATDDTKESKRQKDIDKLEDSGDENEQSNNMHPNLEEPPKPLDMELSDNQIDKDDGEEDNRESEENMMDIDKMKAPTEMEDVDDDGMDKDDESQKVDDKESGDPDSSESDNEEQSENRLEENLQSNEDDQNKDELNDTEAQNEISSNEKVPSDEPDENSTIDAQESNTKTIEKAIDSETKGSNNQNSVENDPSAPQDVEYDDQDIENDNDQGMDKVGVNSSEQNDQGITRSKPFAPTDNKNDLTSKRNRSTVSNDKRTLDDYQNERKKLKTIDQKDEKTSHEENGNDNSEEKEFQHVQDAEKNDKSTLDSATKDQSKQVKHEENLETPDNPEEELQNTTEFDVDMDEQTEQDEHIKEINEVELKERSTKSGKSIEKNQKSSNQGEADVDDTEITNTATVPRGPNTTAHTNVSVINDNALVEELSTIETLELLRLQQNELTSSRILPNASNFEEWQRIAHKMLPNARELCEQLRLILEPTKRTRFRGDYRTGQRINMKKIIPYIASQFRKDKIWMRRTKPAQRDYKITIAVDNSKSMNHNNVQSLTVEAISLISQALTLLESGSLAVLSFGEKTQTILHQAEQFEGSKLMHSFTFDENHSRIAKLLDYLRIQNDVGHGSENTIFEKLLLILSDGRNIFSEGENKVRDSIKLTTQKRIFIIYVIIDNHENKHSITDVQIPIFSADKKTMHMSQYLEHFPFPHFLICNSLKDLPNTLSTAMRQWFELVNSTE